MHCGESMALRPGHTRLVPISTSMKRTINTIRSMDYRLPPEQGGGRFQRCSRCHTAKRLDSPVIYNMASLSSRPGKPDLASSGLAPIMIGNELVGFICGDCFVRTCQHLQQIFPDCQGFPHTDQSGLLQPTPRCDTCNAALQYASDGRSVICPKCDVEPARFLVEGDSIP